MLVAVMCSSTPLASIVVKPKTLVFCIFFDCFNHLVREESFRFLCIVQEERLSPQEGDSMVKRKIAGKTSDLYAQINNMNTHSIDDEHKNAWKLVSKN